MLEMLSIRTTGLQNCTFGFPLILFPFLTIVLLTGPHFTCSNLTHKIIKYLKKRKKHKLLNGSKVSYTTRKPEKMFVFDINYSVLKNLLLKFFTATLKLVMPYFKHRIIYLLNVFRKWSKVCEHLFLKYFYFHLNKVCVNMSLNLYTILPQCFRHSL